MKVNAPAATSVNVPKACANATSFLKGKRKITLIFIHGFTGSAVDMQPIAQHLHEQFNINCICINLPGHDGNLKSLQPIHHQQWLNHARSTIQTTLDQGYKVHLMGLSMGGALSIILAGEFKKQIKSVALLAPALWTLNKRNDKYLHALTFIPRFLFPKALISKRDMQGKIICKDAYPLKALIEYKKISLAALKHLSQCTCPAFFCYSKDDDVIDPYSAKYAFEQHQNPLKEILELQHAGHIIPSVQGKERKILFNALDHFYGQVLI